MIDWILAFEFNGALGIFLYWLPAALCAYGYATRTYLNYRKDVEDRSKAERGECSYYVPTDTLGDLIGRVFATVVPAFNLVAATFDVAPEVLWRFFRWFGKVFDQPLVPKRQKIS